MNIFDIRSIKNLSFKDIMKKFNLKNDIMNESELQRFYNYPIHPRVSRL